MVLPAPSFAAADRLARGTRVNLLCRGVAVSLAALCAACLDTGLGLPAGEGAVWANPRSCRDNAPAVDLPAARRDSLPPAAPVIDLDDAWERIARHVPGGFSGIYLQPVDGRNTLTINLVDTSNAAASLDSLRVYYPIYQRGSHYSFARDSVLLRVVRWNWIQLNEWYRYVLVVAGLPDGLTMTDIDEVENRLYFGAESEAARDVVVRRMVDLNVPCWLAVVDVTGSVYLK